MTYRLLAEKPANGDRIYDVDDARNPTEFFGTWVADATDDPNWVEVRYDNNEDEIIAVEWRFMYRAT